jgi:glycosyltransferase involved in cell wall biosynthesis
MFLSIITPCKNRLGHLRQTLPLMRSVDNAEVIVVDYGCEQGTGDWVAANYADVKVVRVTDDPVFHVSRARNIGASQASAELLCFIDADTFVIGKLAEWIVNNLKKGWFFVIPTIGVSTAGFLLCNKADFLNVGGYDEALRGWAPEDMDLYERLEISGVKRGHVPASMFSSIEHGDELRQFGPELGAFQDRQNAFALGAFYRIVKRDIRSLTLREPELEFRQQLFEQIKRLDQLARQNGNPSFNLSVNLGSRGLRPTDSACSTALEYRYQRESRAPGD